MLIDALREWIPEASGGVKIEAEQWLADFLEAHPFGDKTCDTQGGIPAAVVEPEPLRCSSGGCNEPPAIECVWSSTGDVWFRFCEKHRPRGQ